MKDPAAERTQRTPRTQRKFLKFKWIRCSVSIVSLVSCWAVGGSILAQSIDWTSINDEATRLLEQYVRIDSSNPPGNTRATADFLAGVLGREQIAVQRFEPAPGKSIILARLPAAVSPPAGKPIVLLHHMDVVPVDRQQWKVDPFAGVVQSGEMWGRGALDMKGLGVVQLMAFLTLRRQSLPLARDVVLLANPDEEIGGESGARWMLTNHYRELDPEFILDEGGFGSPDLFATGKLAYGIAVAEKKIIWLRVRATGEAGHGSQPNDRNPNDRLVRALARLQPDGGTISQGGAGSRGGASSAPTADGPGAAGDLIRVMRARVGAFAANKFTNAVQHSTIAVTSIRSGVGDPPKVNVIPSVAEATLDCRLLPGITRAQWLAEIRRQLGDPGLEIEVTYESDDPVVTPYNTSLYRNLEAAIRRKHPEAIVTPILIPYGTDGSLFRTRGVNTYGIFPGILPADSANSMHGDAEHVPLSAVHEAIQILYETIRDTAAR